MPNIALPDVVPYLLAILGLLLLWQLHDIQVKSGRIQAAHAWDRSGIRFFLHVGPDDEHACPACRTASGMVFRPSIVAAKGFQAAACTNPACRCQLVGLYGAWAGADRILARLQGGSGRAHLSNEEMTALLEEARARRASTVTDQVSLSMISAVRMETSDPKAAIEAYRFLLERAKKDRELTLVVPAYLRLAELLDRQGERREALDLVERFLQTYAQAKTLKPAHRPTEDQLTAMSVRKTRLVTALKS